MCICVCVCVYKTEEKDGMRGGGVRSAVSLFIIELIIHFVYYETQKNANCDIIM